MDLCHLKNSELEPQYQKYKGRVVLRGWFACCVHWTRISSITNDSRNSHGHYIKASRMFRTSSMTDPVGPLERNLQGLPLAGLLWERKFEKVLLEHGWEKVPNWDCLFVNRAKGLFLSVYVDDIKLASKKQNVNPTWKILMKDVDLGEPISFLDHVFLGCTQRECQIRNDTVANHRDMFESRISAGAREKLPTRASGKSDAETISSWSYDMEGNAKKCVER